MTQKLMTAIRDKLNAGLKTTLGYANPTVVGASVTAPGAGAVIADTGALAAGTYRVELHMGYSGGGATAGRHVVAQHRDAANTGNIVELALCPSGQAAAVLYERVVIAANERIRCVAGAVAGAAAEVAHASIRVYLLA